MKKFVRITGIAAAALFTVGVQAAPHHAPPPPRNAVGGIIDAIVQLCRHDDHPHQRACGPAKPAPARHQDTPKAPHHR